MNRRELIKHFTLPIPTMITPAESRALGTLTKSGEAMKPEKFELLRNRKSRRKRAQGRPG